MKLIFAVLYLEVFYIYISSFSTIFYAISLSDTCIMDRKSISNQISITYINLRPRWTTSGFGKRTVTIFDFHFRILYWRMCSHRRVILHLFSKFRTHQRIGGGVVMSYRVFKMAAYSRKCTSGFRFSDGICLRWWKLICLPNFDDVSQFTAEIKLLPVSEHGMPPYRNSISGFNFDVCTVIGILFYICLPHFVVIGRSSAELWRHINFSKWRP